jgi:hypothetical protein
VEVGFRSSCCLGIQMALDLIPEMTIKRGARLG